MSRRKQKRKPGDCEICGFRGCPACSEEELFRQMGITSCEVLEDDRLFPALADEIKTLKPIATTCGFTLRRTRLCFPSS